MREIPWNQCYDCGMNELMYNRMFTWAGIAFAALGLILYLFATGFHPLRNRVLCGILMAALAALSWFLPLPGCAASAIAAFAVFAAYRMSVNRLSFRPEDWMSAQDFEAAWQDKDDESGNYVILTARGTDPSAYDNAYVGGSPTVRREIHHILNDRLLSRVYDDIQEGMNCWIRIIPAPKDTLDKDRQKLIELYHGVPYLLSIEEVRKKREKVH